MLLLGIGIIMYVIYRVSYDMRLNMKVLKAPNSQISSCLLISIAHNALHSSSAT